MPGLRGVITVNGKAELPLCAEEHTAALTAEAMSGILQSNLESTAKLPDTVKRIRTILQQDSSARQELD